LKTALRHFLTDEERRRRAAKRGGNRRVLTLSGEREAEPDLPDPSASTPESVLDDLWRAAVLETAARRLEEGLRRDGKVTCFAVFRDYFLGREALDYRAVAVRYGIRTDDVSNLLRLAKHRYRQEVRAVVLETVRSPEALEEELRWLLGGASP